MRPMWKGAIAFGLVNIPVELYSATRDHRPRFRLLHAKDESPVHYERVCQADGKPVAWEDLVKGFEYREGPVRRPDEGRFQDRGAREDEDHRHHRFRRSQGDRRALFRDAVLPAGRQGGRSCLRAHPRGDPRVGKNRHRQDHSSGRPAPGGSRSNRRRARAHDDALRRRAGGPGRLQVPEGRRHPAGGASHGPSARGEPEREVGAREVHRRIPRQPDAGDQGQAEREDAATEGARAAEAGRGDRSDGAAAGQPRGTADRRAPARGRLQEAPARRQPRSGPDPVARRRGNGGWRDAGLDRHSDRAAARWSTGTAGIANARARCSISSIPTSTTRRPIALRNPIVFYEGHLPAFSVISFLKRGLGHAASIARLRALFARGIDPESEQEAVPRSGARTIWPTRAEVLDYGARRGRRGGRGARAAPSFDLAGTTHPGHGSWRSDLHRARARGDAPGDAALHVAAAPVRAQAQAAAACHYELRRGASAQSADRRRCPPGARRSGRAAIASRSAGTTSSASSASPSPEFDIDAHSVTNADFLQFIGDGGYDRRELWDDAELGVAGAGEGRRTRRSGSRRAGDRIRRALAKGRGPGAGCSRTFRCRSRGRSMSARRKRRRTRDGRAAAFRPRRSFIAPPSARRPATSHRIRGARRLRPPSTATSTSRRGSRFPPARVPPA